MVNIQKLKARMVLKGYNQQQLLEAIQAEGYKMGKNTLSATLSGRRVPSTDDADIFCKVLDIENPTEKCEIFLA